MPGRYLAGELPRHGTKTTGGEQLREDYSLEDGCTVGWIMTLSVYPGVPVYPPVDSWMMLATQVTLAACCTMYTIQQLVRPFNRLLVMPSQYNATAATSCYSTSAQPLRSTAHSTTTSAMAVISTLHLARVSVYSAARFNGSRYWDAGGSIARN